MLRKALFLSATLVLTFNGWADTRDSNGTPVGKQPDAELVTRAIQTLDDVQQDKKWLFTMTIREDGEERVITHDARKEPIEQRELLSVDGEPPDKNELKDFREAEKKRLEEQDPNASFFDLIDINTISELERHADNIQYAFTPRLKDLEKAEGKVGGILEIDHRTGLVSSMEIFSAEEFSPAFSVTLKSYRLSFKFHNAAGTPLLTNMTSHAVGKAGFLKKFDTRTEIEFSDYRPVQHLLSED